MSILASEIRGLRPGNAPWRKTDSKGLYLEVFPNGSKLWRYKFRIAGREKRMALTLAQINTEVREERLFEMNNDAQNL